MPTYIEADRPLTVTTPLGKDDLLLIGFNGQEAISQLFEFQLELIAENDTVIPFEKLLGQKVTIHVAMPGGKQRHFSGICSSVAQGERDTTFTDYRMEVVPQFWFLTKRAQSRIFQQMTVPDILKRVLEGLDVVFEIQGTFYPRDYCVQYRESDFNFACRLMEEEGIYYFFKHAQDGHRMVLANTPQGHPPIVEPSTVRSEVGGGRFKEEGSITSWEKVQELRSGKYTLWDHCFELPHKHLEAEKLIQDGVKVGQVEHKLRVGNNGKLELYDFPGGYAQRFDGIDRGGGDRPADLENIFVDNKRTVDIRMQQEAVPSIIVRGASFCRQFTSGHRFTLEHHFNGDGPYVLTSVQHTANLSPNYRSGEEVELLYHNSFTCIPAALAFRPPRVTPSPFVQGTQTAVVVGPPGEEIFTDKFGRVKVQFHWDRQGQSNADSSCWVRVAQVWAGKRWGASFWPRIGQEVIVDFLEGDPDQPIIIGSVYNADQMPPYQGQGPDHKHPSDNKLSGVKSNTTPGGHGFNEWRFDDTKGKEQVFIHGARDMDIRVENDCRERVVDDRHLIVGYEKDGQLVGDQREWIHRDKHLKVGGNQAEAIGGSMSLSVGVDQDILIGKNKRELIKANSNLHVEGDLRQSIDRSVSLTVGGGHEEKVHDDFALQTGGNIHLKALGDVLITAGGTVIIKGGGGFIVINDAGIVIEGMMVKVNCGAGLTGGVGSLSPANPEDATPAAPQPPAGADNAVTGLKSSPS